MFDINAAYDNNGADVLEDIVAVDPKRTHDDKWVLPLMFNIEVLDLFCLYVMNLSNTLISRPALTNMQTMIDITDKRMYNNSDVLKARLEFISLALEARVNLELDKKALILSHIQRSCDGNLKTIIKDEIIPYVEDNKVTTSIIDYINKMVFENLVEGYSVVYAQELLKLFEKKENNHYKKMSDFSKDFKDIMRRLQDEMRDSEEFLREGRGFDLSSGNLLNNVRDILTRLKAPSNKLRTGLQYLNRMLNGGFESGRSYLIMGLPAAGKSVILLSIANWIRKYNKGVGKDPTKKQAVLFLSQENSKDESFERFFNINITDDDIRNFTPEEVVAAMELNSVALSGDTDINFIFQYFEDREIGVQDIDDMIIDLDKKGVEVIAVVQDYIERLKPKFKFSELRHSLGSLATELSQLAKRRSIPVISAAQLNRSASSIVDNAVANNKKSTTKLLGRQNVSESWDMMKNVDAVIIINVEIDESTGDEKRYMGFKLEKFRGRPAKDRIYVFVHPFAETNGILLLDDINTKPKSKLDIKDFQPLMKPMPEKKIPVEITGNEFTSFIDGINDSYNGKSLEYAEILKRTDEIDRKMTAMREREASLKERRNDELKKGKYDIDDNGLVIIKSRKKKDDGLIRIGSRKKVG